MRSLAKSFSLIVIVIIVSGMLSGIAWALRENVGPISVPWQASSWSPVDTSEFSIKLVGSDVGRLEGQSFTGLYTDSVVVDRDTGIIVVAWARMDADSYNNDYIYLGFNIPVDTDGDGYPDAYHKIIKKAGRVSKLDSLDSISLGEINGGKYVLVTWTYYDYSDKDNVGGALFTLNGTLVWSGDFASTSNYEEFSRSCYLDKYNDGNGGFLIIWYDSGDKSIDGRWLFYDSNNGWSTSAKIDIASTNNLYYKNADQMLCISGSNSVLAVYRKWDSNESKPDLYASLIYSNSTTREVKLYDYDGSEETIGVRGAYTSGYYLVPVVSGSYLRYDIVVESSGDVIHKDYVGKGAYPYAIALQDRFVLAWIDYYNDADGEPKIANIDLDSFDIHPHYGVSVTGGDNNYDYHPILTYGSSMLLYFWSGGSSNTGLEAKYAVINLGEPTSNPSVETQGVLLGFTGNQTVDGAGAFSDDGFFIAIRDYSDGEVDLLGYYSASDSSSLGGTRVFMLPGDSDEYKQEILSLIDSASESIHIAVGFWDEGENPCSTPGTIAHELVVRKQENSGLDIRVILDDSTGNSQVKSCLSSNGISVIDDSSSSDPSHIMHDKFMVVDGEKVIIATVNFIVSDFYRNNNTAVYLDSKAVAYFYDEEFEYMWNNGNGRFGSDKAEDHSFIAFTTNNTRPIVLEGYFQPERYGDPGRTPNTIAGYIYRAQSSVYFTAYIFTTSGWVTPLYNSLVHAKNNGRTVIGVFDELYNVDTPGRRLYWLLDNGITIAISNHKYKVHAKLFVIDNKTSIIGSWNPTGSATWRNDEDVIIIREPDNNGISGKLATYILSMYNDNEHFTHAENPYNPVHPIITKVMFYPDTSGKPDKEWVEITNPTDTDITLAYYLIGDSEDLLDGDNESLYKFPSNATIPAGSSIIVAYNATAYYQEYHKYPDYELVNSTSSVPTLQPYNTSKFTGTWNLDDDGDEVILGKDYYGFIVVVDAVWYGNSTYMTTSIGIPQSAQPLNITNIQPGEIIIDKYLTGESTGFDAIEMNNKYTISSPAPPVPESIVIIPIIIMIIMLASYKVLRNKEIITGQ